MKTFQILYTMKVSGSIELEAESEDDAERQLIEELDYQLLFENAQPEPDIEVDDLMDVTDPQVGSNGEDV